VKSGVVDSFGVPSWGRELVSVPSDLNQLPSETRKCRLFVEREREALDGKMMDPVRKDCVGILQDSNLRMQYR
jgi:hypothetical protein